MSGHRETFLVGLATTTTNPPPSGRGTARLGGIQNIPAGIYLPHTAYTTKLVKLESVPNFSAAHFSTPPKPWRKCRSVPNFSTDFSKGKTFFSQFSAATQALPSEPLALFPSVFCSHRSLACEKSSPAENFCRGYRLAAWKTRKGLLQEGSWRKVGLPKSWVQIPASATRAASQAHVP